MAHWIDLFDDFLLDGLNYFKAGEAIVGWLYVTAVIDARAPSFLLTNQRTMNFGDSMAFRVRKTILR